MRPVQPTCRCLCACVTLNHEFMHGESSQARSRALTMTAAGLHVFFHFTRYLMVHVHLTKGWSQHSFQVQRMLLGGLANELSGSLGSSNIPPDIDCTHEAFYRTCGCILHKRVSTHAVYQHPALQLCAGMSQYRSWQRPRPPLACSLGTLAVSHCRQAGISISASPVHHSRAQQNLRTICSSCGKASQPSD